VPKEPDDPEASRHERRFDLVLSWRSTDRRSIFGLALGVVLVLAVAALFAEYLLARIP